MKLARSEVTPMPHRHHIAPREFHQYTVLMTSPGDVKSLARCRDCQWWNTIYQIQLNHI
jgi:hypothetical protein